MIEWLYLLRVFTRSLYQVPGIRKISKLVQWYYASSTYQFWIDDFDQDLKIKVSLADHIGSNIFWFGSYSKGQLHVLQSLLSQEDVFFDIGANIGVFTLFTAKRIPAGHVHAFEPVSTIFDLLLQNAYKNNFTNISFHNVGLWHEECEKEIFIPQAKSKYGPINIGQSSLFRSDHLAQEKTERVALTCLDHFVEREGIKRLDHIKIDIEGAELFALRGAEQTLRRFRPNILIEINQRGTHTAEYESTDILRYLRTFGYTFYRVTFNGKIKPINEQHLGLYQNVLCIPS